MPADCTEDQFAERIQDAHCYLQFVLPWLAQNELDFPLSLLTTELWLTVESCAVVVKRIAVTNPTTFRQASNLTDADYTVLKSATTLEADNQLTPFIDHKNATQALGRPGEAKPRYLHVDLPLPAEHDHRTAQYHLTTVDRCDVTYLWFNDSVCYVIELFWSTKSSCVLGATWVSDDSIGNRVRLLVDQLETHSASTPQAAFINNLEQTNQATQDHGWVDWYSQDFSALQRTFEATHRSKLRWIIDGVLTLALRFLELLGAPERQIDYSGQGDFNRFIHLFKKSHRFGPIDDWLSGFGLSSIPSDEQDGLTPIYSFRDEPGDDVRIFFTSHVMRCLLDSGWSYAHFRTWQETIDGFYADQTRALQDAAPPDARSSTYSKFLYVEETGCPLALEFDYTQWKQCSLLNYWRHGKEAMRTYETRVFNFEEKGKNSFLFIPLTYARTPGGSRSLLTGIEFGKKGRFDLQEKKHLVRYAVFQIPVLTRVNQLMKLTKSLRLDIEAGFHLSRLKWMSAVVVALTALTVLLMALQYGLAG